MYTVRVHLVYDLGFAFRRIVNVLVTRNVNIFYSEQLEQSGSKGYSLSVHCICVCYSIDSDSCTTSGMKSEQNGIGRTMKKNMMRGNHMSKRSSAHSAIIIIIPIKTRQHPLNNRRGVLHILNIEYIML